ncbi:L-dopachrome tautomerase-related protein [Labrenzia sp. PHM005]|uniref:L-dopachrome tautomerase-related protein n=1 Tax=Labrenzia sp. PHM005 TaxID=2590016 RepID=UPI00143DA2C4|nr:L-dopachrome tautomerase-related protein [Labrenzia sp. PHM005]
MKQTILTIAAILTASPVLAEPVALHKWTTLKWAEDAPSAPADIGTRAPLAGVEGGPDGTIFVSVPRWIDAQVPATINRVDADGLLHPWPNAATHNLSDPKAIRNGLGGFIDSQGRYWILDLGWVAGEDAAPEGGQKLLAYDVKTGKELVRYEIGPDVANPATSFLNDLHVDEQTGTIFITDSGNRGGSPVPAGLIVYDIETNTARRVLHNHPSVQDDPDRRLVVDGVEVFPDQRLAVGTNGITRAGDRIWWSITTGDALYSVPEALLRDPNVTEIELAAAVEGPLRIGGGSDGLAADEKGRLWITNLALNRVEVLEPGADETGILFEGGDFVWPDSLASDFAGGILLSTNRLNSAFTGKLAYDGDDANFAIWRIPADLAPTR